MLSFAFLTCAKHVRCHHSKNEEEQTDKVIKTEATTDGHYKRSYYGAPSTSSPHLPNQHVHRKHGEDEEEQQRDEHDVAHSWDGAKQRLDNHLASQGPAF